MAHRSGLTTGSPLRHPPRTGELLELLNGHIGAYRPGTDRARWLFEAAPGQPVNPSPAGRRWRKACRAAGVAGFTLHDLRHFYASGLIHAGCDVVTVQRALGHASATTTLRVYAHLWPKPDRTRNAAAGLMAAALNSADDSPRVADSLRTAGTVHPL